MMPNEGTVMTDNVENLVLEHLRAIRGALSEQGDRLRGVFLQPLKVFRYC
jgi:hypothetical protein